MLFNWYWIAATSACNRIRTFGTQYYTLLVYYRIFPAVRVKKTSEIVWLELISSIKKFITWASVEVVLNQKFVVTTAFSVAIVLSLLDAAYITHYTEHLPAEVSNIGVIPEPNQLTSLENVEPNTKKSHECEERLGKDAALYLFAYTAFIFYVFVVRN